MKNKFKPITVSAQEKKDLLEKVIYANQLMKSYALQYYGKPKKTKIFREKFFRNEITKKQARMSKNDYDKIMEAHNLRDIVLGIYVKAIYKTTRRWHKFCNNDSLEDLEGYGILAFYDAFYSYRNPKIKFLTYLYVSLRNTLVDITSQTNTLSGLRTADFLIYYKIEEEKIRNPTISIDELYEKFNLQETDILRMEAFKNKRIIYQNAAATKRHDDEDDVYVDYTEFAASNKKKDLSFINSIIVREAIRSCNFNELELDVVICTMCPFTGWPTEVAKRHINPNTRRPYTRQNIHRLVPLIYKRIENKLKEQAEKC